MSTAYTNPPRRGAPFVLVLLLAMACATVFMIVRSLNKPGIVEKPAPARRSVPLASADLQPGRKIQGSDFYLRQMTQEEENQLTKGRLFLTNGQHLTGRLLKTGIKPGQPFFLESLYPEGTGPTPAELLSEGMRAVTVRMTLVGGLRGLAAPSTWVDVLFRRKEAKAPVSTDAARTHTLLSGVRVLAIEDNTYANSLLTSDKRGDVADEFELTLELTPEQAEVLKSVEDRGDLSLNMLPSDPNRFNAGAVPSPELMKLMLGVEDPQPDPVVVAPAVPPSVRVIRGGTQSSVTVDFPTDVIIDQSLYPAPHGQSAPQPEPPTPTGDAPPAARPWPTGGAVPEAAEPAADDSSPAADQPQQTSHTDEPSMVRYPVNSASRTVIRPGTVSATMRPLLFPQRTPSSSRSPRMSYPADFRSHPVLTVSPARPASFAITRSRFVAMSDRPASRQTAPSPRNPAQKNGRQLPLLPSGPQGVAGQSVILRSGSAQTQRAQGSQRPVLLAAAGPASAAVGIPRTRIASGSRSWSTALMSSVAAPPSSTDLPLLKSGPQD